MSINKNKKEYIGGQAQLPRPKRGNGGQAMFTLVVLFLFVSTTIVFGVSTPVLKQVRISNDNYVSKSSHFLAEAGIEDVLYRLKNNKQLDTTESLSLNGYTVSTTISDTSDGKQITSTGDIRGNIRKTQASVVLGSGATFHYGIQSGRGGFILENSSSVTGNVYSNGSIIGTANMIYGDAVSASSTGLIDSVHVTGSAYAHTIKDSIIDKNAYYVTKTSTIVSGFSYPDSPDMPNMDMPIPDEQIYTLEADAEAGGIISSPCPYKITSSQNLGPAKITCDLEISGDPTVTLKGSVWVTGKITVANTAIVRISPSLGNRSVSIVADKSSDRTNSSTIGLNNSVKFYGSGFPNSFIFLISMNNSAELGGSVEAVSMDNTANGAVILYAPHGLISINNSSNLKEVTGYKIRARNSANIIYDSGLMNTIFSSGPGGGYDILNRLEVE